MRNFVTVSSRSQGALFCPLENINVCLKCIENLGVNIEGLKAEDIREGNLRTILGLFFNLSRYKQQRKSGLLPPSNLNQPVAPLFTKVPALAAVTVPAASQPTLTEEMLSRLPSPFKSAQSSNRNSTGGIPHPVASAAANNQNRRSLTSSQKDKISANSTGSGNRTTLSTASTICHPHHATL
ncbi:hypothetical protein BV898_03632 [Hypsibius exemplaris]|uniref:Calponin-homology (CH) domain-containing protein n=1 Tax=Hypsibius exemplaris TaxID=2072580 RepID=A0A1W0X4N3_HYPEX|nr:hypothetical protein BV898_03632 [Hypsibius exemplaris]